MIEGLLYDIFGEMPAQRLQKCRFIYYLARSCPVEGAMVDLGTWHGYSTISMMVGSLENDKERRVYTVDTFTHRHGWVGEAYGEEDLTTFHTNLSKAKPIATAAGYPYLAVIHLSIDVLMAADKWPDIPIALLHWDLGCDNRLEEDLRAWMPHVTPGGTIALHDTMNHRFGANVLLRQLEEMGVVRDYRTLPAGLQVAIKEDRDGQ